VLCIARLLARIALAHRASIASVESLWKQCRQIMIGPSLAVAPDMAGFDAALDIGIAG